MGKLNGKVAFVTGAARGQGRSHAILLAEEGADIIAIDICQQAVAGVGYALGSDEDLQETVALVEKTGRKIHSSQADVRDRAGLQAAFDEGQRQLGPATIVVANAGVSAFNAHARPSEYQDTIDVNLTGVYNTVEVSKQSIIDNAQGGSIVLISSTAGLAGVGGNTPGGLAYTASKHAVVGLMRAYANYLAPHSIRVNTVHPAGVNTPMVFNENMSEFLAANPLDFSNALPIEVMEPIEISHAVLWLVSEEARYVTGIALPVDAGFINKR